MNFYYNKHNINQKDISAVIKTLKSERITQGKKLLEFEDRLKKYFNCKYCVVVSSGTAAQFLLAKSLNWKKKDNIILSPLTFVSGANSILSLNATPVFVDIKKIDQNLDPHLVEKKIIELKKKIDLSKLLLSRIMADNLPIGMFLGRLQINTNCN